MKIEVHLQGGLRKIIDITPGATVGATIGKNVFNADGTLFVPAQPASPKLSITSWELILNIPPNVTALANTATTGLYVITGTGTSATRSIQAAPGETTVSNGDGVAGNPAVGLADVADTGAGALRGITRDAKGRINGTTDATITGTAGQVDVANGDAAAGLPTISLADVADAGGGTFKLLTRDAKGRLSGTSDGDTDDVPEGAGNLYFTAARVRDTLLTGLSLASSAVISATDSVLSAFGKLQAQITGLASTVSGLITQTITNGDTTHAPSGDAVFDALAGKEPSIAAGTDAQFWRGDKVFSNELTGPMKLVSLNDITNASGLRVDGFTYGYGLAGVASNGRMVLENQQATDTFIDIDPRPADGTSTSQFRFFRNVNTIGSARITVFAGDGTSTANHVLSGKGFNSALVTTNGNLGVGTGSPSLAKLQVNGDYAPHVDNAFSSGISSRRHSVVYAATGTIDTSDAREKTIRGPLTEQELAWAADIAMLPVIYQWNEAVSTKGDDARLHCSPTVQAVIESGQRHGLDPFRYGFVCYDQWDEQPEVRDSETGEVVEPALAAGDRYSLRPAELQFFVARGQEERIRRLEALLNP